MRTVLVVTADKGLRWRLQQAFGDYSVFTAEHDEEAVNTLRVVEIDAIFRDCDGQRRDLGEFVEQVRELMPPALVVALRPDEDDDEVEAADFVIPRMFSPRDLQTALRHVTDKQRLLSEIAALRSQVAVAVAPPPAAGEASRDTPALARILTEFSRAFAAGFDLPRVLDMFLDALTELLRPARLALLMPDEGQHAYHVVAHRGLAPRVVESARLSATAGLGRWLIVQARPARLAELSDPALTRDLSVLGGVVAVPLLTHGDLVGILVVGHPVVGNGYGRLETEVLFDLATHLATAIRDITLHHQVEYEKAFSDRILAHMSSGVVTIGRDHRIGTFNRRAEEILGLTAADVLRKDLRSLPSPLGDMLYETLTTARSLPPTEVQLALRGLWLEVSSYPVRGDEAAPLGAVLVFEDRTAQKELAAQKRQAEQYQLLARVIARLADEIKNPLVSINTFVELLDERFDEPEFRRQFSLVVRRDVHRLLQVLEKLGGLVSDGEIHCSTVDLRAVVQEVVRSIQLSEEQSGKRLRIEVAPDQAPRMVRVDPGQFRKALSYLIWHLTEHSPGEEAMVAISIDEHSDPDAGRTTRVMVSSRTASVSPEKLDRLFDPVHTVQESLIDIGPAVSQRLIEATGGRLGVRRGRHELAFQLTLPTAG
jgi:PAS domain S-box-containing protein